MTDRQESRREFLKIAGSAGGAVLLSACSGNVQTEANANENANTTGASQPATIQGSSAASSGSSGGSSSGSGSSSSSGAASSSSSSGIGASVSSGSAVPAATALAALKSFLSARSQPGYALPGAPAAVPDIAWFGALSSGNALAPSALPNGTIIPVSHALISRPLKARFGPVLAGNPTVGGYPCLAVLRPYSCKGLQRSVGSPAVLRFSTDAPVVEMCGAATDNSSIVQSLMIDGTLVPPTVLSAGRGLGGWDTGTVRLSFGTRQMRDIWIQTGMAVAYIKIDQYDSIVPVDDRADPQMTVVGDSYQQVNSNAFGNGGAMALEIAARLGIRQIAIDSIGGTGYYNSGSNLGSFYDRLSAHGADGSAIYLVVGGLNDYGDLQPNGSIIWPTRAAYEATVSAYLNGLRTLNPNAVIIVTAPFCPNPPMSDASYVAWPPTNTSGLGDFLYNAQVHRNAIRQVSAPWVYVDVLMGTGWLNSSGASGDITNLQWFTGGTPAAGTTATNKPGNTGGGGGGGFGGVQSVGVVFGGKYSQAPDVIVSGGSGTGLLLGSVMNSAGAVTSITVLAPGDGYTSGAGLPRISLDPTYEQTAAVLVRPTLTVGINPNGQYPLPSFAPPGSAGELNNIYTYIGVDRTHPSPLGVSYLAQRLAADINAAVQAL